MRLACRLAGLMAAALSGAVAVLYLVLIVRGDVAGPPGREWLVALIAMLLFALPACAAAGALWPRSRAAVPLLVAALFFAVRGRT